MRLTLRTLLAYMDDILEPADHEELGQKIEASDFASELIHRSRDTVRRLRLGAPAVLASGSDDVLDSLNLGDANSVAEYLDNTLPPEQVADFERMCLEQGNEPDMHLAEVASCHHVLTMVLGEPAAVDAELKSRMYQLPKTLAGTPAGDSEGGQKLRIEAAHAAAQQENSAATSLQPGPLPTGPLQPGMVQQGTAPAAPPLAQPASLLESELPDYLREAAASKRRSRRRAIATVVLVLGGSIFYWFASAPPAELPTDLAQTDIESFDAGEIDIEGLGGLSSDAATDSGDASSEAPPFVPESSAATAAPAFVPGPSAEPESGPPIAGDIGSGAVAQGVSGTAETAAAGPEPREPDGNTPGDQPVTAAAAGDASDVEMAVELAPNELKATALETPDLNFESGNAAVADTGDAGTGEADRTTAAVAAPPELPLENPVTPAGAAEPMLIAAASDLPVRQGTVAPQATVAEADTAPQPVKPRRLGNYLGNNDVLLIYSAARDSWVRMPPRSPIATGDELLTLPKFRTHVVLADVNTYLSGGTRLKIPGEKFATSARDAELNLEIVYGRLLLNAGLKGSLVTLQVGEQLRDFSLASSASLAVEADRMFVPGSDYEHEAAPIKAIWYLTSGSVEWPTAAGGTQTIQAPASWKTIDGIDEIPERMEALPTWVDREPVTDVERIARGDLAKELVAGDSVGIRLLELTDGKGVGRKKEVRILAAASSLFVGEFEPLVKALNDSDQKRAWDTHINDLRQALALSPDVAVRVRQAFVRIRGDEAARDLMELVVGYSPQQIGESREAVQTGALLTLLRWLDHDSLDYRVLAIHNLREITGGVSKGYRPDDSIKRRKIDLRKIWDQFEANELLPRS